MKITVKLPISPSYKPVISENDKVTPTTPLMEITGGEEEEVIPLSRLLKIKSSQIPFFLKKRIGDDVDKGEILAQKKRLFSTSTVTSPFKGRIKEIDLKKGTLTLLLLPLQKKRKEITIPASGKVLRLTKNELVIELEGFIFRLVKSGGSDILAKLVCLESPVVGIFDINKDVEDCLVLASTVTNQAMIKLEVLGTKGLILLSSPLPLNLPFGQVDREIFQKLLEFEDKKVWLRPKEKEIVIID